MFDQLPRVLRLDSRSRWNFSGIRLSCSFVGKSRRNERLFRRKWRLMLPRARGLGLKP